MESGKFANRQFQTKPENTRVCEPPKGRFLPTLPPQSLPLKYSSTREPRQACTPRETKGKESWSKPPNKFQNRNQNYQWEETQTARQGTGTGNRRRTCFTKRRVLCNKQNLHCSTALSRSHSHSPLPRTLPFCTESCGPACFHLT